jgi:DNA-binding transcriptional regulator YhcF (GntR family)
MLEIALDRDADVPVGTQLAWALRARILAGALAPGDRLPALHQLADDAGVNVNTVRAVYQRLEHDGLVTTRHGSGTFVSAAAVGGATLAQLVADAARAADAAGVDPRELAAALYVGGRPKRRRGDSEATTRRRLRAQIAALEHALAQATAGRAAAAERTAETPPTTPRPRLLNAAELAAQRDELLRRLADVHAGS